MEDSLALLRCCKNSFSGRIQPGSLEEHQPRPRMPDGQTAMSFKSIRLTSNPTTTVYA